MNDKYYASQYIITNMKLQNAINKIKIKRNLLKTTKAIFIWLVSGWRYVGVFGYPQPHDKNYIKAYLVTSGDGTIIDVCLYYGKINGKHTWQQAGFSHDMYPDYRDVILWKPLKKEKKWSHYFCKF